MSTLYISFLHMQLVPSATYFTNLLVRAVKKVEFVSDRMSYIILRGRWLYIIVLNVHSPTEDKTDDVKDSFMRNWKVYLINSRNTI
jgi:hypothetical protein